MRVVIRQVIVNLHWALLVAALAGAVLLTGPAQARGDEPRDAKPHAADTVLLEFCSEWCGPCQTMKPTVDALADDGYAIERVDVDRDRQRAAEFGVASIPCFVVVQRGKEIDRVTGVTTIERLKVKMKIREGRGERGEGRGKNKAEGEIAPPPATRHPSPAWRYERPTGHRAAVVRIYCQESGNAKSIGSGTLVRWGSKIVVLTARHVVKDAKTIIVELFTKKTHHARILKVDATWDCAVLELTGKPEGVEPVDIELGPDAMQKDGSRLESCGYGPDGKLAANSGLFLGYRRSTSVPNGPDDWMIISGHARQGDSGGGVFNARGRLVGVLWGTDGKEVVCVQAGRVHKLLDEAAKSYQQRAYIVPAADWTDGNGNVYPSKPIQVTQRGPNCNTCGILQRTPTAPKPAPEPSQSPATSIAVETAREKGGAMLPWRGGAENRDSAQQAQLDRLIELERLRVERMDRDKQSPPVTVDVAQKPKDEPKPDSEPSPLLAGLCVLAGVVVGFVVYFGSQKA